MKNFFKIFVSSFLGVVFGLIAMSILLPMILLMIIGPSAWSPVVKLESKAVLHVLLDGEVVDSTPSVDWLFDEGRPRIRLQKVIKAIRLAREDKHVVGAVLDIRSPGIGWSSATAIRRELEAFKEAKKFVYTYADRLDEVGFYMASGTEKTFMQPNGDIELDGLAAENPFMKGLFAKLEVKPLIFRVGRFKAAVEPLILDKMSPENRLQTSELVGDLWSEARAAIAARAGAKPEELDHWVDDLTIRSVAEAKKAGIVADALFSDEFDERVKQAATWESKDDANYISMSDMAAQDRTRKREKRKVALLIAEGEIVKGEGGRDQVGDDTYLAALQEIEDDEDVAAVVVRINSPGGDALASDVLWRQLTVLDEKRPVVASMGDIAASGGYYMAAGARHIVAEPTTITGSIGVFGVLFNAEALFKNKLGINFDRVTTHKRSEFGGYTRPLEEKEQQTIQAGVERTYKRFVEVVAQSREFEKVEQVEAIAEGRVWSGKRAVDLGLVDELGGLDRAISKAAEFAGMADGYEVEIYPRKTDRISRFLEQFAENDSMQLSLRSVVSRWLPKNRLAEWMAPVAGVLKAPIALSLPAKGLRIQAREWLDAKSIH